MWDFPTKSLLHTNFLCSLCLVLILPELRIYYIRPVLADTWHLFCFLGWVQSTGADGHLHRFLFPKKTWHPHLKSAPTSCTRTAASYRCKWILWNPLTLRKSRQSKKRWGWHGNVCVCVKIDVFWLLCQGQWKEGRKGSRKGNGNQARHESLVFFRLFSCSQIQAWWL